MATTTEALTRLTAEIEVEGLTPDNAGRLAKYLARNFGVREEEVGILRLEGTTLVFCYPTKLQEVGRIPLNSSSSLAARTASTRRSEILNNFSQVKHTSFFEAVDLSGQEGEEAGKNPDSRSRRIQKLMSVPVMEGKQVAGVIQVSRKGSSSESAGADFTQGDLHRLTDIASAVVSCFRHSMS